MLGGFNKAGMALGLGQDKSRGYWVLDYAALFYAGEKID
jgi:hypothetical protein